MIIKARIIDNTKIELLEDAKAGDVIDLKELVDVDLSFLNNKIATEATALYQKNINDKYELKVKSLAEEKATALRELDTKKSQQITDLKKQIELAKKDHDISLAKAKADLTLEYEKKLNVLNNSLQNKDLEKERALEKLTNQKDAEIAQIKNDLANKDKDKTVALNALENKLTLDFNTKLAEKQTELIKKDAEFKQTKLELSTNYDQKINQLRQEKEQLIKTNEIEVLKIKNDYQNDINNLHNEIDNLKLAKSSLNVKKLGEALERWCNEEYLNYASIGFKNCLWEKDNEAIKDDDDKKGTKADYIFKVYLDSTNGTILSSVCCEMKNEDPNSVNKKKNSDHFAKLDKDRTKKGCEYALLVSELEWDSANDAPIKVIPDYPKMYLVRPPYFIAFLAIIYNLAEKYRDLLLSKNAEVLNLKDRQDLVQEFDDLIKTYLNDPLDTLNKRIEEILKSSAAITAANQKIIDACNDITTKTITRIKTKIDTLELKKLPSFYKRLDKINTNND